MKAILERTLLFAAAGTAVGSIVLAISAWRAVAVEPPAPEPLTFSAANGMVEQPGFRALPLETVALIADNEPFREDRQPAPLPYRMPGDRPPQREERDEPPPPQPPAFTILGTVLTADGGIAVIQTSQGASPQLVNVNESVGGYRLVSVGSEGATLARDDQMFNLAVADPAILREQQAPSRGRNNNQRREQEEREADARRVLEQQTERIRALMEQAQQNGGAGAAFFGVPGQAAPGARVFVTPDGQGGNVVIEEQQFVEPRSGQVRQRVIAIPRGQRQGQ